MTTGLLENKAESPKVDVNWVPGGYRCRICLIEEDGDWTATVLNLPGAASCGKSAEEASSRIQEAIEGVIESYVENGKEIPWCNESASDVPKDAKLAWILVNA